MHARSPRVIAFEWLKQERKRTQKTGRLQFSANLVRLIRLVQWCADVAAGGTHYCNTFYVCDRSLTVNGENLAVNVCRSIRTRTRQIIDSPSVDDNNAFSIAISNRLIGKWIVERDHITWIIRVFRKKFDQKSRAFHDIWLTHKIANPL